MRKIIATIAIVALLGSVSCKKEKADTEAQKPVKTAVVEKKVEQDTVKKEAPKPVVEKVEPPKPADKYFLIAGSFENRANADVFKAQLESEGFKSEVIERPGGPNGSFYKVSYKSFYDRGEAYAELKSVRFGEGRDDVWLLVKK